MAHRGVAQWRVSRQKVAPLFSYSYGRETHILTYDLSDVDTSISG